MYLTRRFSRSVLALFVLALSAGATGVRAADVDEIAQKNAEAKGGMAQLQAIKTLRRSGKLIVNGGLLKLDYAQMQKRGGMIRDEATLQGLTVVQAYDGTEGWQVNPFQGRKDAERTPPDDNKGLIEDSDIDGPLVDYKAKHYQLEDAGTEDVDGTPALKLKLTRPGGDIEYIYLDPDHFLEIRSISLRTEHGVPVEMQVDYGDYEKVAGVYFPFSIVSGKKGSSDKQVIEFDKGQANLEIKDAKFQFPKPGVTVGPVSPTGD
jgi:hypothetical protein